MTYTFPSGEWMKAMAEEVNRSESYRKAAAKWEGDFYFIAEPDAGLPEQVILYIDLWHGEARDAGAVDDEADKSPEFVIRAPLGTWRKVIEKKLDPIQGMMTGRLKLKGTMSKIMRFPKAASELVNCATRVPTEFPGE
ncbi:MAG: SCP2 sterol-binding domain-containing protein [Anaerolineae bacterium]|jgi:putative sterol carrier protein